MIRHIRIFSVKKHIYVKILCKYSDAESNWHNIFGNETIKIDKICNNNNKKKLHNKKANFIPFLKQKILKKEKDVSVGTEIIANSNSDNYFEVKLILS